MELALEISSQIFHDTLIHTLVENSHPLRKETKSYPIVRDQIL
jgi:hypothetical protein